MKKLWTMLLALSLLLCAAAAAQASQPLPQVGEVVNGFEVKEIREVPIVGATAVLFEHQKTGAGLMFLANEDTNRVFDLTFLTRPIDNTGLPHVFEHSTLDGSEKYPSKALFFNLSYQTYNTYMNASTYSVMTTYPVASLSEAQLLKYADYYTDSCFNPSIMTDESIVREEAWRYRLGSLEDDLTIEGTVYSEMLGAMNLDRQATYNYYRTAFPGSVVGFNQGGDPENIPEMTWDSLKNYHNLFYHPSNCMAFLYGDFEDYTAFTALLDGYFSRYEKEEFRFEDSAYTPITGPVSESFPYPMEANSDPNNASTIYYSIVCPGLKDDPNEEMVVNTLTDLLVSASSPLMQTLRRALPTASCGVYIETTAPDDAVTFYASSVNPEDADLFVETVNAALADVAANGFTQEMVDGVMASLSMDIRLTPESSSVGVDMIPNIAYSYATSGDPFNYMDYVDALANLDDWNQQGLYKDAVSKWLLDSTLTATAVTYPVPGMREELDAALAAHLAEVKAAMSEEELQALVDATNAPEAEDDAAQYVAQLQAVTVASLPEEIVRYPITDETDDLGVRHLDAGAGVEGIGQVAIFLDAHGLPQEEIHWFKLFTQLVGQMDTSAHTREELDVLSTRYLYNREVRLSLMDPTETEDYRPFLRMGWTGMDEDLADSYALMRELVFDTDFTDTARLTEAVQGLKSSLKQSLTSSIYNILVYRAFAVYSPLYRYYNYINYLDYYAFLEQVEAVLAEQPEAVAAELKAVQDYFANSTNATVVFAGSNESAALNRAQADAFFAGLRHDPIEHVVYDIPAPAHSEGIIADINVQFNSLVAGFEDLGVSEYEGSLDAISALVSDMFLYPLLRDQYGAYGAMHHCTPDGGMYMFSYRDPNVAQTFEVFDNLPDMIAELDVDQATLDGYILSSYSSYALSTGELAGAMSAAVSTLNGDDPEINITYMRQLKAVTPESVKAAAEIYRKLAENGVRATAGSAAAINANAERYEVILNPFGAVDASQVELVDVPEDSEHYAAVRYMFENGLMAPVAADTFGVDEPATVGDIAAVFYVLIGGPAGQPEEAVAYLAQFGVVEPDTAAEPMTDTDCEQISVNFLNAMGMEATAEETAGEPITRGDLAESLMVLCQMIGM